MLEAIKVTVQFLEYSDNVFIYHELHSRSRQGVDCEGLGGGGGGGVGVSDDIREREREIKRDLTVIVSGRATE